MEDSIWKRNFLHCTTSVPRLEDIAAVNVVIQLWKQHIKKRVWKQDLGEEVCRHRYYFPDHCNEEGEAKFFDEVEEKTLGNLTAFLPKQLKTKAAYFFRPIGIQVLNWMDRSIDDFTCFTLAHSVDYISWTMKGTIDVVKTLEMYFTDIKDIEGAFFVACRYCLEDYVYRLWAQMPEILQNNSLSNAINCGGGDYSIYVTYWICCIKSELHRFFDLASQDEYSYHRSACEDMFIVSLHEANVPAVKYFWNKLTEEEKSASIVEWIGIAVTSGCDWAEVEHGLTDKWIDIFCFLLLKMNNENLEREVFNKYGYEILKLLCFDWLWRPLLMPTIELMWDFLNGKVYADFLSEVAPKLKVDKGIANLFKELWHNSPKKFKKCFIERMGDDEDGPVVLLNLCQTEDHYILAQILRYASTEEKRKIVFSTIGSGKLFELFYSDKLSSLKVLVEEVLSECEIANFKTKLIWQCGGKLCQFWICDNNWQSVENLLHWCFVSDYEIGNFKREQIDKFAVFRSLACVGNYELVNTFIDWCFRCTDEIRQFRDDYLCCKSYNHRCANEIIVELSYYEEGWNLFEKFISYWFSSQDEVNQFKELLTYNVMQATVHDIIAYGCNFDFSSKFLSWRYSSEDEINQFKKELRLSYRGKNIYNTFTGDFEECEDAYSDCELVNKLNEWYF